MNKSVLRLVFECVFPGPDLAVRRTIQTRLMRVGLVFSEGERQIAAFRALEPMEL
jgi:hypothetical protein